MEPESVSFAAEYAEIGHDELKQAVKEKKVTLRLLILVSKSFLKVSGMLTNMKHHTLH